MVVVYAMYVQLTNLAKHAAKMQCSQDMIFISTHIHIYVSSLGLTLQKSPV